MSQSRKRSAVNEYVRNASERKAQIEENKRLIKLSQPVRRQKRERILLDDNYEFGGDQFR